MSLPLPAAAGRAVNGSGNGAGAGAGPGAGAGAGSEEQQQQQAVQLLPLTCESVARAREEGPALDAGDRARMLLTLCAAGEPALRECRDDVAALLSEAERDADEWVRVTAALVRRAMPEGMELRAETEAEAEAEASEGAASGEAGTAASAVAAATTEKRDAFDAAVANVFDRIESRRAAAGATTVSTIPLDLCPLHWPYLAYDALPASLVETLKARRNPHFSPVGGNGTIRISVPAVASPAPAASAAAAVAAPHPVIRVIVAPLPPPSTSSSSAAAASSSAAAASTASKPTSEAPQTSTPSPPPTSAAGGDAAAAAATTATTTTATTTGASRVPAKVQKIMREATALTAEGRGKIEQFYATTDKAPAGTAPELVLLSETEDTSNPGERAMLRQYLKLDFVERQCVIVKRRVVVKGGGGAAKRVNVGSAATTPTSSSTATPPADGGSGAEPDAAP